MPARGLPPGRIFDIDLSRLRLDGRSGKLAGGNAEN